LRKKITNVEQQLNQRNGTTGDCHYINNNTIEQ